MLKLVINETFYFIVIVDPVLDVVFVACESLIVALLRYPRLRSVLHSVCLTFLLLPRTRAVEISGGRAASPRIAAPVLD